MARKHWQIDTLLYLLHLAPYFRLPVYNDTPPDIIYTYTPLGGVYPNTPHYTFLEM